MKGTKLMRWSRALLVFAWVVLLSVGCEKPEPPPETELVGKSEGEVIQLLGEPARVRELNPPLREADIENLASLLHWAETNSFRELVYPDYDFVVCVNNYADVIKVRKR